MDVFVLEPHEHGPARVLHGHRLLGGRGLGQDEGLDLGLHLAAVRNGLLHARPRKVLVLGCGAQAPVGVRVRGGPSSPGTTHLHVIHIVPGHFVHARFEDLFVQRVHAVHEAGKAELVDVDAGGVAEVEDEGAAQCVWDGVEHGVVPQGGEQGGAHVPGVAEVGEHVLPRGVPQVGKRVRRGAGHLLLVVNVVGPGAQRAPRRADARPDHAIVVGVAPAEGILPFNADVAGAVTVFVDAGDQVLHGRALQGTQSALCAV